MVELHIPDNPVPTYWTNYFYSYETWREVEEALFRDWRGQVVFHPRFPGLVEKIVFNNNSDATIFLLRWS